MEEAAATAGVATAAEGPASVTPAAEPRRLAINYLFLSGGKFTFMGKLEGKVILVTGGSRGIGLAIVQRLGNEGARLVLVARKEAALRKAAKEVPGGALVVKADVTQARQVERLFKVVGRELGRLDILINNAGVFTYKPFLSTSLDDWRRNLETNLTSLFLCTRAALPLLRRSRAAHLVNILSVSSLQPFANCSAYTASKFGALGLTWVLREELSDRRKVFASPAIPPLEEYSTLSPAFSANSVSPPSSFLS